MPRGPRTHQAPAAPDTSPADAGWVWEYHGYDPSDEPLRETLCTLGNGYLATRGAAPEVPAGGAHYPGTYVAGCYNRLVSEVAGRRVENEDLVNLPNWLPLRYRLRPHGTGEPGPWLGPDGPELTAYRQRLDLRGGTLERRLCYRDTAGRTLHVTQTRLVHMADCHLAALRTVFTAEGWSGTLEVESALDGEVTNAGVARYRDLNGRHLTHVHTGTLTDCPGLDAHVDPADTADAADTVWLRCRTTVSDIRVAVAARTRVTDGPSPRPVAPDHAPADASPARAIRLLALPLVDGRSVTVEKTVAVHTSRDLAISDPLRDAVLRARRAPDFDALLASHRRAWRDLWRRAELRVAGEPGRVLRLHLFHLLQTLSPHTAELDVGVPARGLHGEAYRGHVFWDELFVLPFLNLRFPEVSRALLNYRHRRLARAVRNAAEAGWAGAQYPWQSGSDGREETQTLHLNPRSGRWLPDHSRLQHHVGSAVAYNLWTYAQATGDVEYLHTKGAEVLLCIARYWADRAHFDPDHERYRILGVVGPDEYHESYPGADRPGLDDNAYTNVTAAWVLGRALELLDKLPAARREELSGELDLTDEELARWDEVSRRLRVPFHRGVISQFDGYGELAELDWDGYRRRYGDIRRLDRILEAEGDAVDRYQATKQADVLMLGYLFSPSELAGLFRRLGYRLDDETWRATVDYYLPRTSHGSTLSPLVHGWVLARARRPEAWRFCREALLADVTDVQGGTTTEGIHLGLMAGTLDLVQRGLTGLETREGALWLDPTPLPELSRFSFTLRYRDHWEVRVRVADGAVQVALPPSAQEPIRLVLGGRTVMLAPGDRVHHPLPAAPDAVR